jgi:hypothetical protein
VNKLIQSGQNHYLNGTQIDLHVYALNSGKIKTRQKIAPQSKMRENREKHKKY